MKVEYKDGKLVIASRDSFAICPNCGEIMSVFQGYYRKYRVFRTGTISGSMMVSTETMYICDHCKHAEHAQYIFDRFIPNSLVPTFLPDCSDDKENPIGIVEVKDE